MQETYATSLLPSVILTV